MAIVLASLQAVSELYLPGRFQRASHLYGTIGTTVVILGWFFILGRAIVVSIELNSAIHARYGSVSRVFFAVPIVRLLPLRSPRVRVFFDLDSEPSDPTPSGDEEKETDP
jgi:uncharacterized BrkB/YihY/UPF0761 family membrane protein